jgi:hypothetical protein
MTAITSKRLLHGIVALLGLVPVTAGLYGVIFGPDFLQPGRTASADLDSHFRYLSGLFLGIGITFYACVAGIERKTMAFRIAAAVVALGGLARLGSLLAVGVPSAGHLLGLALELIVVPLLVLWQGRVAAAYVALAQSK